MHRDWLIILLSGQGMLSVSSAKSFDDMLSYPALDLGFSWYGSADGPREVFENSLCIS